MSDLVWPKCGHPKTPENTVSDGRGRFICRKCRLARARVAERIRRKRYRDGEPPIREANRKRKALIRAMEYELRLVRLEMAKAKLGE